MRTFSWSKINSYAVCPQLYRHRYLERLKPIKKAPALALGNCIAQSLNAYRKDGSQDDAFKAFTSTWKKDGEVLMLKKDDDPRRSVERGLEILSAYIKHYPDEAASIIKPEVSFNLEIMPDVFFNGRIDAVIRLADGSLGIIEDKTTSRLGPVFFTKLKGSSQILWYMWISAKLGLFDIDGKQSMPKCMLNAIYIHDKTLRFERDITIKTTRTLDLAYKNMLQWIKQIEWAEKTDTFPMNNIDNEACVKYGGCDYLPLKFTPDNLRERIIQNEFTVSENR